MTTQRTCRPAVRPGALRMALLLAVVALFVLPDALVGRTQTPGPADAALPDPAQTVFAAGDNSNGSCNVSGWSGVTAVSSGYAHTVGLRSNGTVLATGNNERGQCDVSGWSGIVAIAAGGFHTVGLKSDGTVVSAGLSGNGQRDVSGWSGIVAISAGYAHTVGLRADGTAVAVGAQDQGRCNVSDWTGITAIAAGFAHTLGLRSNGTVVAVGHNLGDGGQYAGQCDVSGWSDITAIAAGGYHSVGLRSDGTVVTVGTNANGQRNVSGWTGVSAIAAGFKHTVGLNRDGILAAGDNGVDQLDVSDWRMVTSIAAGYFTTIGLKSTIVAVGLNAQGQCNAMGWSGITAVAAGNLHTIGLRGDGTAVAVGENPDGRCDVTGWRDVVAVAGGWYHTVGVRSDGTVVSAGANPLGQCDVSAWTRIRAITAGGGHSVGLRDDGTVVAAGWNNHGQCDLSGWNGIVAASAGYEHTVGLKSDGTVVAAGWNDNGQCNVSDWREVAAVAACTWHTVGLRSDGTVVATGGNTYGQCDVSSWTEIVAVCAGYASTVGLRSDGTVVAVGWNMNGQCNVYGWTGITAVSAGGAHTVGLKTSDPVPALASIENQTATEGASITLPVIASDADGDTLRYTATLLPPDLTIHPTTGVISGTLTYRSAGTYHPTITVTDNTAGGPFGDNASQTFTWTVSNTDTIPTLPHQPNRTSAEGESVDVQLTGAGDADGDTLTWSATGLPPDLSISATGRVTGTLTYTSAGSHTVTITVTDNTPGGPGGDSANRTFTWTVTDTDTTPTLEPQPDRENYEGQTVNVLLTGAADVDGDPLTWSAAGLPPGLRISAAGRISGIIANGAAVGSPYTVTVTVTDNTPGGPGGDSAGRTFTWTVRRPTLTIASPNGGEEWNIGTRATITWESAGVSGLLKIELSRDGGGSWQVLSTGAPNSGTFAWTVTGTQITSVTSQALVRITSLQNRSVSDVSDHPFHIINRYGHSTAVFRLNDGIVAAGRYLSLPLRYAANNADVTTATLDVLYDPALLTFRQARPGSVAGTSVVSRVKRAGCVGLVITGFPAGAWDRDDIAVLAFQAADGAGQGDSTAVDLVLPETSLPGVDVYDRQVAIRVARAEGIGGTVHFGTYGDLNGNGIVDVGDVQMMKNVLLGYVTFNPALHDLDFNGVKDAGDLSALIDLFLYQGGGAAPTIAAPAAGQLEPQGLLSEADIDFSTGANKITAIAFALKATLQAGQVSFVPPPNTPARDDLRILQGQLADGTLRVLVYSETRTPLPSYASFRVRLKAPTSQVVKPERPSSAGSIGNDGALSNGTLVAVEYVAPPPAPVITSCRAVSTTEVQLAWGRVAGAVSYDVRRGEPWSETPLANVRAAGTGDQTYRDVRLEGRTGVVKYQVRARNAGGRVSAWSNAGSVTVLPAPTGVLATALSSTQVQVTWQYSAPGATGFAIEGKGSTGDWDKIASAAASARSRTVAVPAPGTRSYRVKATNATAVSSPSSASTLTVLPPVTALQPKALSSSEVQLDWSYPAGLAGYTFVVERLAPEAAEYTVVATLTAGTLRCNDRQARIGAGRYRVRAHNLRGYSSGPVASITVLAAPTGLTAALLPGRQVKLDWGDNSAGESGFKIERFDNGAATPAATVSVAADMQTKTLTVPRAGDYAFRVRAYNSRGSSSYSNTRSVRVQ